MKPADNIPIFYIICLPPVFGRLFIAMTGGGSQCPSGWKMLDRLWRTVHHEIAASSAIDDDVVSDVNCARKQAVHFHLPGARMEINKTSVTSWSQWKHNILVAWLNNKLSYTVEQLDFKLQSANRTPRCCLVMWFWLHLLFRNKYSVGVHHTIHF